MEGQLVIFNEKSSNSISFNLENKLFTGFKKLCPVNIQDKIGKIHLTLVNEELGFLLEKLREELKRQLSNISSWTANKPVDLYMKFEGVEYPIDIHRSQEKDILDFHTIYSIAQEALQNKLGFHIIQQPVLSNNDERRLLITIVRQKKIFKDKLLSQHNRSFINYPIQDKKLLQDALDHFLALNLIECTNDEVIECTLKGTFSL